MGKKKVIGVYRDPAADRGALKATGEALALQGIAVFGAKTLLHMNQPKGFHCSGCAWSDLKHTSSSDFCENGAKAVAWDVTANRYTPEFFAAHSVSELTAWDVYDLEMVGRLIHPMAYDRASDRYLPISWEDAFALVGHHLNALDHPDQAYFYTSERASNEAVFPYQLFVCEFGSNNFPDCSNMCHEATSIGLPQSIGVGKVTALLEDFDYADAIVVNGIGITQHHRGVENIQQIENLALQRGNVGRTGAGICSVRGHSNAQGNHTVGITEKPSAHLIEGIECAFGFCLPEGHGREVIATIDSMMRGDTKVFIALGGNFAAAIPDWVRMQEAIRKLDLTVHIATKLNRSHLLHGKDALILPCLCCTEIDIQADRPRSITVEDSMSMVHASAGQNEPASPHLLSERAIVAGIAHPTLGKGSRVPWEHMVANYARIRDALEIVSPIFQAYKERVRVPGGFHLASTAPERVWATPTGRANFLVFNGLDEKPWHDDPEALWLMTMRRHDQYDTTLDSHSDRSRGVFGQRNVVFMNQRELEKRGLHPGERANIVALSTDGIQRIIRSFKVIEYSLPDGCCGAYYAGVNPLVPLYAFEPQSRTPSYKSLPVTVPRAAAVGPDSATRAVALQRREPLHYA
jgi:anaerobic selenocysteine-containing dehydrogenase